MKILIVEDNPTNMKLAAEILKNAGYEVLEAYDAESGIDLAIKEQPPLIFMDIQLPRMDGLAATMILKKDPATKHITIIALTASAMKGDEENILSSGCDDYLAKPFRYKDLLEKVKSFVPPPLQHD